VARQYHPDGGQLFYPLHRESFVVPLALPGDEVTPERFLAFWVRWRTGLYIHPNVWHGAVLPLADQAQLLDRQGRQNMLLEVTDRAIRMVELSVLCDRLRSSPVVLCAMTCRSSALDRDIRETRAINHRAARRKLGLPGWHGS
jgi:Ureidoglycolate lyase